MLRAAGSRARSTTLESQQEISMKFTIKTVGLTLAVALACGAIGLAATQVPTTNQGDGHGRHLMRWLRGDRRIERREFVRSLEITNEQRVRALQAARAVQPAVESARAQALKIIAEARAANPNGDRAAIRETVRAKIQALREQARAEVEPSARALVATLTPEQRQKLAAFAKTRGVTFDENRFTARLGRMLARPRAAMFLERRQGR